MIKEICMPDWDRNWFKSMSEVVDLEKPIEVYRNLHKKSKEESVAGQYGRPEKLWHIRPTYF
jgi:hypothetical protein